MLRLIFCIIVIILLCIYSVFDLLITYIISLYNKNYVAKLHFYVVKIVLKILICVSGVTLNIKGKENIDETLPLFIISNHRGIFDIITGYTLLKRPCAFVLKKELENVPVLGYWAKRINCISLDRKDLRSGAMMVINAVKLIKSGITVWLCPEGTRNKNSNPLDLLEFKAGAFKIPEKANCKILPIAFYGTEKIFEKHIPLIKSGYVYINIGKPYSLNELTVEEKQNIGEYNQKLIRKLLVDIVNI